MSVSEPSSADEWRARYSSLLSQLAELKADSEQVESELEAQLADAQQQLGQCQRKLKQTQLRADEERSHSSQRIASLEAAVQSLHTSLQSATGQLERLRVVLVSSEQAAESATNRLRAIEAKAASQQETIDSQTELLILARQELEDSSSRHALHRQHHSGRDAHEDDRERAATDNGTVAEVSVAAAAGSSHTSNRMQPIAAEAGMSPVQLVSPASLSSGASLLLSSLSASTSDRLRDFIARTETLHSASPNLLSSGGESVPPLSPLSAALAAAMPASTSPPHQQQLPQRQQQPPSADSRRGLSVTVASPVAASSSSPTLSPRSPSSAGAIRGMFTRAFGQSRHTDRPASSVASTVSAQPAPVKVALSRLLSLSSSTSTDSANGGSGQSLPLSSPPQRPHHSTATTTDSSSSDSV